MHDTNAHIDNIYDEKFNIIDTFIGRLCDINDESTIIMYASNMGCFIYNIELKKKEKIESYGKFFNVKTIQYIDKTYNIIDVNDVEDDDDDKKHVTTNNKLSYKAMLAMNIGDYIILLNDNTKITVSSHILSFRSIYFRTMFANTQYKESTIKEIDFSYIDKEIVMDMLEHLYDNRITTSSNDIYYLIKLYNFVKMCELDEYCGVIKKRIEKNKHKLTIEDLLTISL